MQRLILASASPQRKTLLEGLGVSFEVVPSTFDEAAHEEADPLQRSIVLAREKAQDVATDHPDAIVIGCDTLVVSEDGQLLEKAPDADAARSMLALQSGQTSTVHSALCIIADGSLYEDVSSSSVTFKQLSDEELDWWIGTEEWKGRSGSFQIDGRGQLMIEHIEGDWSSIVGLPVFLLGKLLKEVGYTF